MMMKNKTWLYPLALALVALALAFGVITNWESDYLFKVQELNLFLYTPLFFSQQMVVPGGMLIYLGTYMTQFFYHPWLGTLLLCAWCGLLMWLVYKAFALSPRWAPVLLIPLALILMTDFTMGYWIYFLKLRGFFFIAVMGFSLAVALTWLFRLLPQKPLVRLFFIVLTAIATYPIAGAYGLLAVVLMAVIDWRQQGGRLAWRLADSGIALLSILFVPMIYVRQAYNQVADDDAWRQALPLFGRESEPLLGYYLPYALMALLLIILALCYGIRQKEISRRWLWGIGHAVVVAAIAYGCWHFWYKDDNFYREIRMSACIENLDWEGVIDEARDAEEPTRQMVLSKYLAFFKMDCAGDKMYSFSDGSKTPDFPLFFPMVETAGRQFYLQFGLPNFCHRWCIEDGVEKGFRVDHLKYLLRSAVLTGEKEVARKYIDILRQTRYYGDWATHYETLLDSVALAKDPELGPILRLLPARNMLASDKSRIETYLMTYLSNRQTDDPVCADLVMMFALQSKDIPTFWRAFNQYAKLHLGKPMPKHYQEAAYMYGNLEKSIDISHMPFDEDVKQRYQEFMATAQQYSSMGQESMRMACQPRFGNTYFYNYFMMRNLKTY